MPQRALAPRTKCSGLVPSASARPVRVCFLIDELASAGTETQLLALIPQLDRRRVRPFLCLLRGDSPVSQKLEPDGCPILRLGVHSLHQPRAFVRFWQFVRFLRRERIDVLQAYFPDSSYFGVPAAWLAGVKHRLRTRNNLGHALTPLHRRLGRMLNVLTTATVANCEAARHALLKTERPQPESVVVLENGVDLGRFRNLPLPSMRPLVDGARVGVVANLRPIKGLDVFVRAAALLRDEHPRAFFEVAGEGESRRSLELQAEAAGLGGRFRLRGGVDDMPEFLAGLDVAVLCSRAEGMSNALLEYMAAGRPIVATAVGAAPALIENEVHGMLVPPGDVVRLAEAIGQLLTDRGLARRLGESARRRAVERYGREAMVRRFEDFYQRLLNGGFHPCPTS
jgi:glycosyltransferase involved in cell wall biosynthesis